MEMIISFPGGKKVSSTYKGFTVKTDQSVGEGGEGTAPEPFDLFLASIGTCAGIYVSSFCAERQIDSTGLKVILHFQRHATTHMVEQIDIDIQLPSHFPPKYKKAVVKSAELCFVKKHLISPPQFNIFTSLSKP
ncbi:MAG TPA: OsmC family protein [Desulfatirhabdiaceae bacterium]|nr:OsmC family protein [Desulfatirhabdiaceae bacterium]